MELPVNQKLGPLCKRQHEYKRSGKSARFKSSNACVQCIRNWNKQHQTYNTEKQRRYRKDMFKRAYMGITRRCYSKKIPCDITVDYLKQLWTNQGGRCYWLGIPLIDMPNRKLHPSKPSIDRLDPELGYVKGNVVWSSCFANCGRGNVSVAEFKTFLITVREHN